MGVNSPLVYIIYIPHQLAGTCILFQEFLQLTTTYQRQVLVPSDSLKLRPTGG